MENAVNQPLTQVELDGFLAGVAIKSAAELEKSAPAYFAVVGDKIKFTAETGSKYVRIVKADASSRSVFCFLDRATGAILKPASWKTPAKKARGTVHTPTFGVEYVGQYGPASLR